MAQIIGERADDGDVIVDYDERLFDDIQANEGEKAYVFMRTVPFEGVRPIHPVDVLDASLTARREGALVMQTWTL